MPNLVTVESLRDLPAVSEAAKGRLIFGVDATASREYTWETAKVEQAKMFASVHGVQMQLVYYRGGSLTTRLGMTDGECKHSRWVNNPASLKRAMDSVVCAAGETQIERVLRHVAQEHKKQPVAALMFVGDCCEEKPEDVFDAARRIVGVRCFMFQEGHDKHAENIFRSVADITGGAYAAFGSRTGVGGAPAMGDLMKTVAQYATGRLPPESGTPTYSLPKA